MFTRLLLIVAFSADHDEFTLDNLISIETLENGTEAERLKQLERGLKSIEQFTFAATPNEFRIVALGLRHKNTVIRNASAKLLEKLSDMASSRIANELNRSRLSSHNKEPIDRSFYFLAHRPEIKDADAYLAFKTYFIPSRICGRDYFRSVREPFQLDSFLETTNIELIKYGLT